MPDIRQELESDIAARREDMIAAVRQLRGSVRDSLDVQRQIQRHPGTALGVAGAVALLIGIALGRGWKRRPIIVIQPRTGGALFQRAQALRHRLVAFAQG